MTIDEIIKGIIGVEGGYSNHAADRGGETMYGITEKTARAYGYKGAMKDLRWKFAYDVYLSVYFLEPRFDKVFEVSEAVAAELMDTGINCGTGFAKPLLQQSLNLLNRNQKDYKDIAEDGVIGSVTIDALKSFLNKRGKEGEKVLLKLLNIMQGNRYIELCKKQDSQKEFLFGWLKNRIEV